MPKAVVQKGISDQLPDRAVLQAARPPGSPIDQVVGARPHLFNRLKDKDDDIDPGEDPIPRPSAINLDSVESVAIAVLVERIGRLADARMREVCAALEVAVDCGD